MNETKTHCGYAAFLGRPNVGKSTLVNCILAKKISITSPKPQTTRHQILGIKTQDNTQIIYIDTPGIHDTEARAMNRYMNRLATSVIADADVLIFVIEAMRWQKEDELVLEKIQSTSSSVILVINKVDTIADKTQLLGFIDKIKTKFSFVSIVPLSALKKDNIAALEKVIAAYMPESPFLFPVEQVTDKSVQFHLAEIIREKLILATEQEVPYATGVVIEDYKTAEKLDEISAVIWVEREGQKPIIIGKNGERLKKIGTQARKEIEKYLGRKVFLRLWVKIKDNWTDDERALNSLGYNLDK